MISQYIFSSHKRNRDDGQGWKLSGFFLSALEKNEYGYLSEQIIPQIVQIRIRVHIFSPGYKYKYGIGVFDGCR